MQPISKGILFIFLFFTLIHATTSYDVSIEKKVNYNSWGAAWDTVVAVKNNIITVAAVPKLGGRVMQYDLGTHPSIYINPAVINKTITDGNTIVGGFRQLPSPQSDFEWPAPPTLDFGQYKCVIRSSSADSCVVYLESQVENSTDSKYAKHKGLQYKRTLTIYKASSRVKVEMVMLNKGATTLNHGIWDITQSDCGNGGSADKQNIWVYFPLNPNSSMTNGYVEYAQNGAQDKTQWNRDIVPGIMGVQYKQVVAKIGADCKAGWICFVDRLDGYAYVKTFTYQEGKNYPDLGASVQVYTYKDFPNTEVEVLGPLTSLAPNDSVTLVENWYAARSKGPIYSVNSAGLITKPLDTAQTKPDTVIVQGAYGVFYPGKARAIFKKADGTEIAPADSYAVSPMEYFDLKDTLKVPAGAAKLMLALFEAGGKFVGNLDSSGVQSPSTNASFDGPAARGFHGNALAIVKKANALYIHAPCQGAYRMELTTLDGKRLISLRGRKPTVYSLPLSKIPAGVLCVRLWHAGKAETKRVMVR